MQGLKDVMKERIEKEQQILRSQAILRMTMLVAFMVFVALYNGVKGVVGLFALALLILASGSLNGTLGSQLLTTVSSKICQMFTTFDLTPRYLIHTPHYPSRISKDSTAVNAQPVYASMGSEWHYSIEIVYHEDFQLI